MRLLTVHPIWLSSASKMVVNRDTGKKAPVERSNRRTDRIVRDDVAAVFKSYPAELREKLLDLRQLILDVASNTEGVGEIEEALRWGEPSYLTTETRSGSTIRISAVRATDDRYAIYFNCQTILVETFRQMYPDLFEFSGNRAMLFHVDEAVPASELSHCIALALRYHLDKKQSRHS